MSKYKPYPKYKESGVAWLGEVPEGWEVTLLKRYCNVTDGSHHSPKVQDIGLPFISVTDVGYNSIDFINSKKISEKDFERLIKEGCKPNIGDVLLTKDGTIGRAVIVKQSYPKFVILSSLGLLSPNEKLLNTYLYYYLLSGINIDQMNSLIHGSALKRMTISKIDNLIISFPSIEDQKQISTYLDQKTQKIDILIEKQQTLIKLLKEKRQALISHAVTKGLDDTVEMKDSGVEWIGKIPKHWDIVSLKYISKITLGKMLTPKDKGNMILKPYLKAKNLKWFNVNVNAVDKMWFTSNELKNLRLKKDDLLVSEGGEVGRTSIWNEELEECYIQNSVNRVQVLNHHPRFFLYQFFSAGQFGYFDSIVNRISIAHLTKEKLGDAKFVKAPLKEQKNIAQYLDQKTKQIDTLIIKSTQAIELLKERRSALISAVVTGKVDVRDA